MTLYIRVKGDTNDADYIEHFGKLSHMDIRLVDKVGAAIKQVNKDFPRAHNWPNGEYSRGSFEDLYINSGLLTQEEIDIFNESYVPHGMEGIHDIASIQILDIVSIEQIV